MDAVDAAPAGRDVRQTEAIQWLTRPGPGVNGAPDGPPNWGQNNCPSIAATIDSAPTETGVCSTVNPDTLMNSTPW